MNETLFKIHSVDIDAVGLGDFGKRGKFGDGNLQRNIFGANTFLRPPPFLVPICKKPNMSLKFGLQANAGKNCVAGLKSNR